METPSYRQQRWYKGHDYWIHGNGYTVFFDGEELFFDTEEEVRTFIDENFVNEEE
jgi:hypothetical protein